MKVVLLAYEAPEDFALRDDEAKVGPYMAGWMAFGDALRKAGVYVHGAALTGPETATMITVKNGRRTVEDGPFADSKEQLGGFVVLNVASLDDAAKWAERCPAAVKGFVDIRVIPDYGQGE